MQLNKTSILAGLNCEKRLFLMLHHPELGKTRKSPLAETGIVVGEHARHEFPGGMLVNRFKEGADPFSETGAYIDDENVPAIFEAGFRHEDTEVFVDILERDGEAWNLIEVKSSGSVKDEYIDDVTVQYMVLNRAGIAIKRVELMYLNKDFIYHADKGYDGLFIRENISDRVLPHTRLISDQVDQLRKNMTHAEPVRHVDGHCKKPYDCEFRNYYEKQDGEYPVSWLPNAAKAIQRLYANGIYDIRNIPADILTGDTHRKIRRITVNGHAELIPDSSAPSRE